MAEIPFARLRLENKAFRFAIIRLLNIGVNVGLNLFFLLLCPFLIKNYPNGSGQWAELLYNPSFEIGYIFLSNLMASAVSVFFLWPEFKKVQWSFDFSMWKRMGRYAFPLVIVGLAGVANEMLDRVLLKWLLPYDLDTNEAQLGIYGACYKLAMIMALFTQAYRYAAEPFFFRHKDHVKAPALYGVITKYFVIAGLFGFLVITLYLDYFQLFLRNPAYREGLNVVPILLIANLMLGVYYNLSVWYKLSDKTHMAAYISMGGAFITLLLNIYWIPRIGYMGSAYATLACYTAMTIASYFIGRRYYPLRINWTKIILYIALAITLYFVELNVGRVFLASGAFLNLVRLGMIMVFLATVYFLERKELNYWLLVQ
jgi:O-antigen/teichoic acid export membrane protein